MGGELLFIEATAMGGSGELLLTGQLGEVRSLRPCPSSSFLHVIHSLASSTSFAEFLHSLRFNHPLDSSTFFFDIIRFNHPLQSST